MLIDNVLLERQRGGRQPHFPMVALRKKTRYTPVKCSGLVATPIVTKSSVELALVSQHLKRSVSETTTLTQHMAPIIRAAEHREPGIAEHQLFCRELRSCILFRLDVHCLLLFHCHFELRR